MNFCAYLLHSWKKYDIIFGNRFKREGARNENMQKIDPTVRRETLYIACAVLICSMLMEAVFLVLGFWEPSVLLGNLLGGAAAVLNFFLMGLSVQKALGKPQKEAADIMRISQSARMLMLFAFAMVACLSGAFHTVAALITLLFPRLAIMLRPLFDRRMDTAQKGGETSENE